MKPTISNNEASIKILNQLILNGFYEGSISPNSIEFERKRTFIYANNHRIIGTLNSDNKFELDFDFKFPLNIVIKGAIGVGIIVAIGALAQGNWLVPILFVLLPFLVIYIDFQLKKKKEIARFTSKFLELYKLEYDQS